MNARRLVVLLVAAAVLAGCATTTTRQTTGRPLPVAKKPDVAPGDALVFGRFYFELDGYLNRTDEIRNNLKVCVTEYWPVPSEERREHWVTTDRTGYYEVAGVNPDHGYNVSKVVFPEGDQESEVNMRYRLRPDHRVLSLGELACIIHANGLADYPLTDLNVYDLKRPLVQHALEKHAGGTWEELIKQRYVIAKSTGGF